MKIQDNMNEAIVLLTNFIRCSLFFKLIGL